MSTVQIERISSEPDQLGECPVWDGRAGHLWWVDIDGQEVHRYSPSTGGIETRQTPGRPGSLVMTDVAGRLLLAMEHQVGWFEWEASDWDPWLDLEPGGTGNRLNDGRCDPVGRYWVGSMYERASERQFTGMLHRIEPSGEFSSVQSDIGVSNGLAFSPSGETMYFADTLHETVWCYDYERSTGERSNERVLTDFTALPGRPDGACVDADGCYWVACVYGWAVARITPHGRVDRIIELPVEKPTMPAFGGSGLETLFVTSIGVGGSHSSSPGQPDAGHLFAIEAGVAGLPEPTFGGS